MPCKTEITPIYTEDICGGEIKDVNCIVDSSTYLDLSLPANSKQGDINQAVYNALQASKATTDELQLQIDDLDVEGSLFWNTDTYYSFLTNSVEKLRINNDGSLNLYTTPTTSTGGYDILTRNTSTGEIEKIASSTIPVLSGNNTFTGVNSFTNDVDFQDTVSFNNLALLNNYTVSTLPTGSIEGAIAYVTDGLAPTYRGTATGGGSEKCLVFYDGTIWRF